MTELTGAFVLQAGFRQLCGQGCDAVRVHRAQEAGGALRGLCRSLRVQASHASQVRTVPLKGAQEAGGALRGLCRPLRVQASYASQVRYLRYLLKVPKCENFDRSDFHDLYTIKSLRNVTLGLK
jgi:hypothetical protein